MNRPEQFRPVAHNRRGSGLRERLTHHLRLFADLQVSTVRASVRPWLSRQTGAMLEVGCGNQPYRSLIPAACSYVGLDIETAFDGCDPDVIRFDGGRFPFGSEAFDAVFHSEVLEHVFDTRNFLSECRRVLKAGGTMVFSVPFQARYHYIPHDYFRFTPSALAQLLADAGFADVTVTPRGTDITVAAYKALSVMFRWALGNLAQKTLFLIVSPLAVGLLALAHLSIRLKLGSQDDCLGYTVTAREG